MEKEKIKNIIEKAKADLKIKNEVIAKKLEENQIRFDDCKDGYTYDIDARNFRYAIFYNDEFYGIRHKFGDQFIAHEIHWDKDVRFGTVRPQKEIEKTTDDVLEALKYYEDAKDGDEHTRMAFNVVKKYLDGFD